jgi:small subunit ribosomal protein S6
MELRNYETVFILTPVLSADQMKDAVAKYVSLLKENGASIVNEEQWGMKKLAYTIQNKNTGFYNLVEFDATPDVIEKIEVEFKRDERILRFLTVSLDKFAVAYNLKRRKGFSSKKKQEA